MFTSLSKDVCHLLSGLSCSVISDPFGVSLTLLVALVHLKTKGIAVLLSIMRATPVEEFVYGGEMIPTLNGNLGRIPTSRHLHVGAVLLSHRIQLERQPAVIFLRGCIQTCAMGVG